MKRILLLPLAAMTTAAASVCVVAPAAQADTQSHAGVGLELHVRHQIARIDAALSRTESAPRTRSLDIDVRSEVRTNINADQSDLSHLAVELDAADTLGEVRSIAAEVADYRASVYTSVVADLHRADRLDDQVDDSRGLLGISLDLDLGPLLHAVQESVDTSVDGALSLDATSNQKEVHHVSVGLKAAARMFAHGTESAN